MVRGGGELIGTKMRTGQGMTRGWEEVEGVEGAEEGGVTPGLFGFV